MMRHTFPAFMTASERAAMAAAWLADHAPQPVDLSTPEGAARPFRCQNVNGAPTLTGEQCARRYTLRAYRLSPAGRARGGFIKNGGSRDDQGCDGCADGAARVVLLQVEARTQAPRKGLT